ncbi:MAG: alpha/beta hydrolase [Treponema sp.]|jgi:pimeloyl-ACP methyl ester carboxylesterase|nr:alpha/beta hydrolase [Treponema sp.]
MEQLKKKATLWLIVAVGLCVISMIGASLIQSGGGRIVIKDLRWETTSGHQMSGLFFVPKGVSAQNKVPAIVVCHGMYNSREMQDLNYVELSRRGFVVLAIDMFNHGNSENWGSNVIEVITSMYEAVKMLDSLPYVDSQRIGITGQSLGGLASNAAVGQDNQASQKLIKAVLLNCADAVYINDNTYVNIYGSRHIGIIAPQYDEVFFRQSDGKGGATVPREFINNSNAQSFLWFGTDPASKANREAGTVYRQNVSGSEAMRVIYNPAITHAWSLFSKRSTAATIAFFDEALKAPNPIPASSQIWQWKVFFNFLGLLGFAFFIVAFTSLMLFTPFFSSLRASGVAKPMPANKKNLTWMFGCLAAGILFGTLIYIPIQIGFHAHVMAKELVSQSLTWGVSLWACFCGLFSILCMIISYQVDGKKSGFNLKERGIVIPWPTLGKTILLAIISVTVSYGLVFIADFFFKTDFRIWLVKVKVFTANKIPVMIFPYLILFLTYYVANSVAVNSFNFIALGKKEWVNTAVIAVAHGLPSLILILLQYIPFAVTGEMGIPSGDLEIMWQFPILIFLPVTAIITRKIYRLTSNPYLAGIINGIIITIISCTNALTWH